MNTTYAEAAYFDGHPCKHVADYEEHQKRERARTHAIRALDRRAAGR